MKLTSFFTNVLSNLVAGIIVACLGPLLASVLVAEGLKPLVVLEDGGETTAAPVDSQRLVGLIPAEPPPSPRPPAPPRPRQDHEKPYVPYTRTCIDDHGNEGAFDVVLFSRAYSWIQGETEAVELNETAADFPALLRTDGLGEFIRESPEIIAIGTASCEGYPEHREREIDRARNRANKLVGWIEAVRPPHPEWKHWKPVKPLLLGVYAHACRPGKETWSQRRVVLLAVRERDEHLALYDCIEKALKQDDELSYLATDYEPGLPSSP